MTIHKGLLAPQANQPTGGLLDPKTARLDAFLAGLGSMSGNLIAAGAPSTDPGNFGRQMAQAGQAFGQGHQSSMAGAQNRAMRDLQGRATQQQITAQQDAMDRNKQIQIARARYAKAHEMGGKDMNGNPVDMNGLRAAAYPDKYAEASIAQQFAKPKLPSGMRVGADGRPEWIPEYIEGQSRIFAAKENVGRDNWRADPQNPSIQVNLTTGERKAAPQTITSREAEKAAAEAAVTARKNERAFQTFQVGMKNLESAMDGATTGPLVGRLPAVSAQDQIADGAVSSLAPVLKNLFRTSGEGTFTDKDQQLLLDMVPTRSDHPEARKVKAQMIDRMVRAKLGLELSGGDDPEKSTIPAAAPGATVPDISKATDEDLWSILQP